MKLFKTSHFLIIVAVAFVGFIIGLFLDKQISEALYVNANLKIFGSVFSNFALMPFAVLICGFAISAFFSCWFSKPNIIRIPFCIFAILFVAFICYQQFKIFRDEEDVLGKALYLSLAIVAVILDLLLSIAVGRLLYLKYDHELTFKFFLLLICMSAIAMAIGIAIKYLWGRPRPIYVFNGENEYSPLWQLHPFIAFRSGIVKEHFKSFPSNHTVSTLLFFPTLLTLSKLDDSIDNDKSRKMITIMAGMLAILVALTRMLAGRHFLSDVSFGVIIVMCVTYFGFKVADYLNEKKLLFTVNK